MYRQTLWPLSIKAQFNHIPKESKVLMTIKEPFPYTSDVGTIFGIIYFHPDERQVSSNPLSAVKFNV